jgi:hypothetical protein
MLSTSEPLPRSQAGTTRGGLVEPDAQTPKDMAFVVETARLHMPLANRVSEDIRKIYSPLGEDEGSSG